LRWRRVDNHSPYGSSEGRRYQTALAEVQALVANRSEGTGATMKWRLPVIAALVSMLLLCGPVAATVSAIHHGAIEPPTWMLSGGPLSIAAAQPCIDVVWALSDEVPCTLARSWVVTVQVRTRAWWRHWQVLSIPLSAQERNPR
jgi:hypothetical protein